MKANFERGAIRSSPDWGGLRDSIAGEVLLPGSPAYESARKPAMARFHDASPPAVVRCASSADVSEAILFARRSGLRATARSGGHCFAGRSSSEGIVIDVSPMSSVSVSGGVATIGAGARLGEVYDALDGQGLAIPAGCGPTVGISGLALGGGLGILGRKHGLTSDNLLGAEVVLADGRVVECDEHRHEDLFWALRGAGGCNFGVVTSLIFGTVHAPEATAFHLTWPPEEARALVGAWQSWAPAGPEELAASLLVTVPSEIERPPTVNVFGAMLGTEGDTQELLDELVVGAGVDPASSVLKHATYREIKHHLAEHGPGDDRPDGRQFGKSEFFRGPLPEEAVAALVEDLLKGRVDGQSRELDFTPWGGAYNRVSADATAFAHRDELFLLLHVAVVDAGASAGAEEAARGWLARSWGAVHPWGSGRVYPNFPDPDLEGWADAYHATNLGRLARVKASYDPDDFFRFHQSIPVRIPEEPYPFGR
jgi:FAD/FMN-containing dehydrogenase